MTAKDRMLQLTNLVGIHKAREHFLSITNSGTGETIYIPMTVIGANINDSVLSANLQYNTLSANLDILTTNANLLVDNFGANLIKDTLRGNL